MSAGEAGAGPAGAAAPWRPRLRSLVPFFGLYVSFGAVFGFLAGGAPLILRARGVSLAEVGLLQAMNLPLGLTFLWAGTLDRTRLPLLPHRIGWIVAAQALSVLLLLGLAAAETAPLAALFALGTAICACTATMDVSLEALVVETVAPAERVLVSTAKFCGASAGGLVGAGLLAGSAERLGWSPVVLALAALAAVCVLPILLYPERRLRRPDAIVERPGGRLARLRAVGGHVLVLGAYFAALQAISGFNGLALVDLGLTLAEASLVSGTALPIINFGMSLAAGLLVRRYGTVPLVTVGAAGLALAGGAMAVALGLRLPSLAVGATLAGYLFSTALGVPVFNMLYRWAEGPRAATDYALLFGAAFFASMPVRVGGPALAGATGWAGFFALAVPVYVAAFWALRVAIRRSLAERPEPSATARP